MDTIDWSNIRSDKGTQYNAFEELVCQLAREEDIPDKISFTRVRTPDSGVEAFCTLKNGDEYGWQVKYFFELRPSSWDKIEASFKKALNEYPHLVKYFICLPINRSKPILNNWNKKIKKWRNYAKSKGRKLEFEYWGDSELTTRLTLEKHAGRKKYWFGTEEFSDNWFADKLNASVNDLGPRYTPKLNFDLGIAKIFDGMARDNNFKIQFDEHYFKLYRKVADLFKPSSDTLLKPHLDNIHQKLHSISIEYSRIDFNEISQINISLFTALCSELAKTLEECEIEIEKALENRQSITKEQIDSLTYKSSKLRSTYSPLNQFQDFLEGKIIALSNLPILILSGEAGIGKSHILADVAKKRLENGKPSILLLGQHFINDEHPWTQILGNILRIDCNEYEFLGALEAKAQAINSRITIFIDAVNEGRGKYFWRDTMKGFIKSFEKYKWIGLVFSVRSSYEDLIMPKDLISDDIAIRETHYGFAGIEYEASKIFFKHYNIELPSVPLLHPEFGNPLFLKTFCEGLKKSGLTKIPEGYEGLSNIIKYFLDAINKRLSLPNKLDYPVNINLVEKAVNLISEKKLENNSKYIDYDTAYLLLENELKKYSSKEKLLTELISEGVFTNNLFWEKDKKPIEGVYFAYERFEDYLTASYLLDKYLDKTSPDKSFVEGCKLFEICKDENSCYINKGLLDALSIQLPELVNKEIYEVAPHSKSFDPVKESFIDSLIWRKRETITVKLLDYINEYIVKYVSTNEKFLEMLFLITSDPKHPFNADFLHKHLMRFTLSDRDSWWTTYIHYQYEDEQPVKRLIDWAWSDEDKSHISDESIRLISKALTWFLTSTNRRLRDCTTKALISILENRIPVLIQILKEFESVNDPYVYERLFAVAYGCSVRTKDKSFLKNLSEYIYETIFNKNEVYPHVLLRDYARGVIEYSLYIGQSLNIDKKNISPPYRSDWINKIPDDEDIRKYKFNYESEDFKDYYWSQNQIIASMTTEYDRNGKCDMYGDFGRYEFQSALKYWKDINVNDLKNLAIKKIFELGYDVEKHGKFDRLLSSHGRNDHGMERIGKKYQWIAFHEILAKVSDNFSMYWDNYPESTKQKYAGTWNPYIRDIDPTMLIARTQDDRDTNSWWFNIQYSDWDSSHSDWLMEKNKLPDPEQLISVKDIYGVEWVVLEIYPEWSEPVSNEKEKLDYPHKNLWYQIRGYIVHRKDINNIVKKLKRENFWGRWMPESRDMYQLFSREYYWSPAYKYFRTHYYSGEKWKDIERGRNNKIIGKVLVTTESILWECGYDYSKKEIISFFKPSNGLFYGLKMKYSRLEGSFENENNEIICLDPSIYEKGFSCLLVRKKELTDFLKKKKLDIFWTVLGEKRIFGGDIPKTEIFKPFEISGVYYLKKNQIDGFLNTF